MGFHDIYTALDGVHKVWRRLKLEATEAHEFVNKGSVEAAIASGEGAYGIGVAVK